MLRYNRQAGGDRPIKPALVEGVVKKGSGEMRAELMSM